MFHICQNESCGFLFLPDVFVADVLVPDVLVSDVFIPRVPLWPLAMTSSMLQATSPETMLHCETFRAIHVFMRDAGIDVQIQ
jgi:hypothetical protein